MKFNTRVTVRAHRPTAPAVPVVGHRGAIAALAASCFVCVTAETLPVGLLPQISHGLSVSEARVGLLLSVYAAAAALTTIPLTAVTMAIPRHRLIAALVAVFALSQAAGAAAPSFTVLVITRLVSALAHGVFWSIIAPAAARLAPPGQAGRVTSLVFAGNSAAFVLGIPLATALGQLAGWRTASAVLAVAAALSAATLLVVLPPLPALPSQLAATTGRRLRTATTIIGSRAIAPVYAVTAVLVIGQFAAYTYIAPLLRQSSGFYGPTLSAVLLGYGAVGVLGNLLVGRYVDRFPGAVLSGSALIFAAALSALSLAGGNASVVLIAVLAWGASFSAVPISLQAAILRVAPHAQEPASAVYVVAYQIGIGAGALIGERLVDAGHLNQLPTLGAAVAVTAAASVLTARHAFPLRTLRQPHRQGAEAGPSARHPVNTAG